MKMPTGISMIVMGVIHFCKFPKIAIFPKVNVIYVPPPPQHAFFFSAFQLISFFSLHNYIKERNVIPLNSSQN